MNKIAETPYFPGSSRMSSADLSLLSGSGPWHSLSLIGDSRPVPDDVGSFADNFMYNELPKGISMRAKPGSYAAFMLNRYGADPKYRDWKLSPQGAKMIGDPTLYSSSMLHGDYNLLNVLKWFELNGGIPDKDDVQFMMDTGKWRRNSYEAPNIMHITPGTEPLPASKEQKKVYPYLVNNSGVPDHVQKTAAYNDVRSMIKRATYSGQVPQFELPKPEPPAKKPVMDYNWGYRPSNIPSTPMVQYQPPKPQPYGQQPAPATAPNGLSDPARPQQQKQQQPLDYKQLYKYLRPVAPPGLILRGIDPYSQYKPSKTIA